MKIGYPCLNWSIGCRANKTFRLKSYSDERLTETVENNLDCTHKILKWNLEKGLKFFRISSELVPFAPHAVCNFDWQSHFADKLMEIGDYVKEHDFRISMHPDQFVVLNSPKQSVVDNAVGELMYHCDVLDGMGLGDDAKIQIHVGGVYGDKEKAMQRFADNYDELDDRVKSRLAIENDDVSYSVTDCMELHKHTNIPVIFDNFHHQCLNNEESVRDALESCASTWNESDGILMCDYSSQQAGEKKGKHADTIDMDDFKRFLEETDGNDFDVMLEIRDKEKSALKALQVKE